MHTYICEKGPRRMRRALYKRPIYIYLNTDQYIWKETHIYPYIQTYIDAYIYIWKETYIRAVWEEFYIRALYIYTNRDQYIWNDSYNSERDLCSGYGGRPEQLHRARTNILIRPHILAISLTHISPSHTHNLSLSCLLSLNPARARALSFLYVYTCMYIYVYMCICMH